MSATTAKKAVEKKNVEKLKKMSPYRTWGHIESECGCVAVGYVESQMENTPRGMTTGRICMFLNDNNTERSVKLQQYGLSD